MPSRNGPRMVALFLFGFVALNPPLLSLFDIGEFVMGIPLLYVYLFVFWAAFIVLMALGMECRERPRIEDRSSEIDRSADSR